MGIRVNVSMGWGFRYCRFGMDPRINKETFHDSETDVLPIMIELNEQHKKISEEENFRAKFDAESFDLWVKGKFFGKGDPIKELHVNDYLHYNYMYCEDDRTIGPMVLTSPIHKDWHRHDDTIDYYAAPAGKNGMEDSVKMIVDSSGQPSQIYPYCGFVNRKKGFSPKGSDSVTSKWEITDLYFKHCTKKQRKEWDWKSKSKFTCGAKSIIEWQRDIVPPPPYDIRLFCEASNLFKNPLTVYRLKPMIMTYWC